MEKFIQEISKKAGKIILEKFGKVDIEKTKAHSLDIVTEADLASNKFLLKNIIENFPTHGIISEETGEYRKNTEYTWIIDPLDGTINFSKKIPLFAVLVCLVKKGTLELASIYDPVHEELFYAKRGKGTYLNNKLVRCSNQKNILHSLGCFTDRLKQDRLKILNNISNSVKESFSISSLLSIGLTSAYVASARRDWFVSDGGKVWDYASSALILKESGCVVTNFQGKPWSFNDRNIIACNKYLHSKLLKLIN